MTKQNSTLPAYVKVALWIPVPILMFFGGELWVEGDNLRAGLFVFAGLAHFCLLAKAVHPTLWVTVVMRLSAASFFFYSGAHREMGQFSAAIGWGVAGLLVYGALFRPDLSVVGIGTAETAPDTTDASTTEESENPE
mgnify:CR=1 FL=1